MLWFGFPALPMDIVKRLKGTLALGSEEDWVSDGLYEGSSTAATEISPEELFPPEVCSS